MRKRYAGHPNRPIFGHETVPRPQERRQTAFQNPLGAYSLNNITAKPNEDGSITVHFGGCDDGRVNCLPISAGWPYAARMYRPRPEILDASWKFPDLVPVK